MKPLLLFYHLQSNDNTNMKTMRIFRWQICKRQVAKDT